MAQRSSDESCTSASNVTDLGKAFPGQPSVAHDSDLEGLTKLAAMKQNGAKSNYPNSPWWCAITTSFNTKWRCSALVNHNERDETTRCTRND